MKTALPPSESAPMVQRDGLILAADNGNELVRWDAIVEVFINSSYQQQTDRNLYDARLQLHNGKTLDLHWSSSPGDKTNHAADAIQYETLRRRLPDAVSKLATGEPVTFGPYAITPDGIRRGRRLLSWQRLCAAVMQRGNVCIQEQEKTRPWHCTPVSQIPNVFVFMALVNPIFVAQSRQH